MVAFFKKLGFLNGVCCFGKVAPANKQLDPDLLETIMDRLEKEAFMHSERNQPMVADDNEIDDHEMADASDCCVCLEGLSEDTNQIIFCDGTNVIFSDGDESFV